MYSFINLSFTVLQTSLPDLPSTFLLPAYQYSDLINIIHRVMTTSFPSITEHQEPSRGKKRTATTGPERYQRMKFSSLGLTTEGMENGQMKCICSCVHLKV